MSRPLTVAERASLLVAARRELWSMQAEMERLRDRMRAGSQEAAREAAILQGKHDTLSSAVRWLWGG